VNRTTIEADNKRRPGILKRNASRYESPPPEPADPNSGKSISSLTLEEPICVCKEYFDDAFHCI
jgi:hypothetical protein